MKTSSRIFTTFCLALPSSAQNSDPPGRVARLSYISGSVSFESSGENTWGTASLNYPLTSRDRLWTDKGARAELETGNLAIRMAEQTDLTTTTLTDQLIQLGLAQGTIRITAYDVHSGDEVEVDTPNGAVNDPAEWKLTNRNLSRPEPHAYHRQPGRSAGDGKKP